MRIEIILELAVLFLLKAIDNLLSTGKQILIQRHRPILASLSVVVSQIIFYRLISEVSASGGDLALYIVSIASGVGTLIAVKLSDRFSKERTFINVILSDDKEASCASLLLANGVPMKQIQEWLGHSDFNTTANIYAHLDYSSKVTSAQAMEKGLSLPEDFDTGGWDGVVST